MIGTIAISRIGLDPEGAESLLQSPSPDWSRRKIFLCDLGASAVKPGACSMKEPLQKEMKNQTNSVIGLLGNWSLFGDWDLVLGTSKWSIRPQPHPHTLPSRTRKRLHKPVSKESRVSEEGLRHSPGRLERSFSD